MLRPKRLVGQKKLTNLIPKVYTSENLQEITPEDYNSFATEKLQVLASNNNKNRVGLRQIPINQNVSQNIFNDACVFHSIKRLGSENRHFPMNKEQVQVDLFNQIAKKMKNQETKTAFSQLNRPKSLLMFKNRPYSCLSQRNRKVDKPSLCQGQIVLEIDKKDQITVYQSVQKMSTSRALMNFSKISRNYSGQRFKVKKDRHLYQGPICLQTQKVILHQKEKKQNNVIEKYLLRSNSLSKSRGKQKTTNERKDRYTSEQEFEIGGWEYFQ